MCTKYSEKYLGTSAAAIHWEKLRLAKHLLDIFKIPFKKIFYPQDTSRAFLQH